MKNQLQDGSIELTVVVPVFNEMNNIIPLVAEIARTLKGNTAFEILYIDDGSTDGSMDLLESLRQQFSFFRYIRHKTNFGQSAAIATGVKNAKGAIIATLDGDGQNDPSDIPKLVNHLNETQPGDFHRTMVAGRRYKRKDTWIKRISSRIANNVRSKVLKDDTPDTGCGLKVFSRQAFLALPEFDHMHRFLPALIIRNGGRVLSVDVNHRKRSRGKSKYGLHNRLWVGLVDLLGVMWLQRRPLIPKMDKETQ